jgi:hypothetical protein
MKFTPRNGMKCLFLVILLVGVNLATNAKTPDNCLTYGPETVRLDGKIRRKTFAGPPNYESARKGDTAEKYWILKLNKPICVNSDVNMPGGEKPERNISEIQLMISDQQYVQHKDLVGKWVIARGKLWHAQSGHHHTPILLEAAEIKRNRK